MSSKDQSPTRISNNLQHSHFVYKVIISRGPRDSKKMKKSGRKVADFKLYPQLVWCFRSVKTNIVQIFRLAKDVYLWGNHSYPHAGFIVGYLLHL